VETILTRQAEVADLGAVRHVFRRSSLSNVGDRESLLANEDALLWPDAGITSGRTRVATVAGHIAGFATTMPQGPGVELEDLFVDPEWMRRGVATALIADVVGAATRIGAPWIEVLANPHAAEFYAAVGFVWFADEQTRFGPASRLRLTMRQVV
jgi:GNAT superfamily N-acetyltransferase